MLLPSDKTILPTDSALITTFGDKLKDIQLLFWNNAGCTEIVIEGNQKWIQSLLNTTFVDALDRTAIDIVIKHKETKCIWLDYTAPKAH